MEHPLIQNIDHLTIDDLQDRINDLYKKMIWAHRSGNGNLKGQIEMALETFRNKIKEKQDQIERERKEKGSDFSDKIDIS